MLNYGLRSDTDRGGAGENVAFVSVPLERQLAYTRVWEARTVHMYSIVASDAGPPASYLQRHLLPERLQKRSTLRASTGEAKKPESRRKPARIDRYGCAFRSKQLV